MFNTSLKISWNFKHPTWKWETWNKILKCKLNLKVSVSKNCNSPHCLTPPSFFLSKFIQINIRNNFRNDIRKIFHYNPIAQIKQFFKIIFLKMWHFIGILYINLWVLFRLIWKVTEGEMPSSHAVRILSKRDYL